MHISYIWASVLSLWVRKPIPLKSEITHRGTNTHIYQHFLCSLQSVHLLIDSFATDSSWGLSVFCKFYRHRKKCVKSLYLSKSFGKLFKTYPNSKINLAPVPQNRLCKGRLFENKSGRFLDRFIWAKREVLSPFYFHGPGDFRIKEGHKKFYRENRNDFQKGKLTPHSLCFHGRETSEKSKSIIPAFNFWIRSS